MDGSTTKEPYDIDRILAKHKPNDTISLEVERGRRQVQISVKTTELPRLDKLPQGII